MAKVANLLDPGT